MALKPPSSEKATISLIRRTLTPSCPSNVSPLDSLPTLTSSPALDYELYALLAIILKEYVSVWYGKITPDHSFVDEIVTIVAHCTRNLEARARNVDWEALLLDELPAVLEAHIRAKDVSENSLIGPRSHSSLEIYHSINPHPALSPAPEPSDPMAVEDQRDNETAYRQLLVQNVLALLLPIEERSNDALRALLEGILGELILGQVVSEKVCEPYFLYEIIAKMAEDEFKQRQKHMLEGSKTASAIFWSVIEHIFLFFSILRMLVSTIFHPLPARRSKIGKQTKALLDMRIFKATAQLTRINVRQPWLAGFLAYIAHGLISGPGTVAAANQWLDRLLSYLLYNSAVADQALLVTALHASRQTLFPHNKPIKSPKSSKGPNAAAAAVADLSQGATGEHADAAAADLLRRRAAKAVLSLVPAPVVSLSLGGEAQGLVEVETSLRVFDRAYENRWVVYSALDRVVGRLMAELTTSQSASKS